MPVDVRLAQYVASALSAMLTVECTLSADDMHLKGFGRGVHVEHVELLLSRFLKEINKRGSQKVKYEMLGYIQSDEAYPYEWSFKVQVEENDDE